MLVLACDSIVKNNKDFGPPSAGKPNYELLIV